MIPTTHLRRGSGFTLVELLVAISIIIVVMGLGIGGMAAMQAASRIDAGINTVGAAVTVIRAYVDRERTANTDPLAPNHFVYMSKAAPNEPTGGAFRGVAVLFTPSGEARLLRSQPAAATATATLASTGLAGFEDIPERDYIDLPNGCVIVGIVAPPGGSGNETAIVEPPFAVWFDPEGALVAGSRTYAVPTNRLFVHYNGDYDANYELTPRPPSFDRSTPTLQWNSTSNRYELPFEAIEAVVGVRIIDEKWYDQTRPDRIAASAPRDANETVTDTKIYRDIFFSRYTGAPLRNR